MPVLKPRPTTPGPTGPSGPAGPQGPTGPTGATGGFYLHSQGVSSTQWDVHHNLGYFPGGVEVIDSGGSTVEGQVTHLDANNLRLNFAAAFSGTAAIS